MILNVFSLETNRDHSLIFESASKYCILDSSVDYDGYSISSKGFLPTDYPVGLGVRIDAPVPLEGQFSGASHMLPAKVKWAIALVPCSVVRSPAHPQWHFSLPCFLALSLPR